ncbi:uncharacterized protein N7482_004101 [Penicillium canariense]|uniref:CST complex subunit STN1 n=1 Tax=Penicillium canariense TaxID=189055 RepID=A0A9W9LP99_9EURO|nr:uncharacterized protein N7482_004101 [Penicillium canariense]KAJ5168507.1 hypothetical protein N7482_004101 [Penicillium canariense]
MATVHDADPTFYPAFCFKASPTNFAWVKMAAADLHRLQRPRGFEGQKIFFYKNHPIRFVSVVGVIVARTEITKRTILTLDDSSGATIDVCVLQSDPQDKDKTQAEGNQTSETSRAETAAAASLDASEETPGAKAPMVQTEHISATDRTALDIACLRPGATVKVKGTLSSFRSTMQLHLERFTLIRDPNAEMQFVDERLQFLVEVLSVPWVLLDDEIEQLRLEAERGDVKLVEERHRAKQRVKRRAEREERDQRHIQRRYEKEERKRAKEAVACKEDSVTFMRDIRRKSILAADYIDENEASR